MTAASHSEPTAQPHPSTCADCGASLAGPFCSQCGEQTMDRHSLTLWHFVKHNLVHEFSHVDGKIFRTFRYLLFRPGFLSAEYFAGRRRRYINPVRLLLTCLLLLALLGAPSSVTMSMGKLRLNLLPPGPPSADSIADTIRKLDVFGVLNGLMEKAGRHKDLQAPSSVEKFNHELKTYGTALSFCNVLLLAGLLSIVDRQRRTLFVEHLIFSLHLASFVLLFSIVPGLFLRILISLVKGPAFNMMAGAMALSLIVVEMVYLHNALLRFYRPELSRTLRWWSPPFWITRLAVLAIFVANSVFITLTYGAGAAIALWRV